MSASKRFDRDRYSLNATINGSLFSDLRGWQAQLSMHKSICNETTLRIRNVYCKSDRYSPVIDNMTSLFVSVTKIFILSIIYIQLIIARIRYALKEIYIYVIITRIIDFYQIEFNRYERCFCESYNFIYSLQSVTEWFRKIKNFR